MGFIEEMEQMSRERNKKLQEDEEREKRIRQGNLDRLNLQSKIELEETKRQHRLRREAEVQFTASGLGTMLSRLINAGAIRDYLPVEFWDERREDGLFHTKVIVSEKKRFIFHPSHPKDVITQRFFNIITDSTGLITFEYGTILPRYKEIQRSVWEKDPNLLEELLRKVFISPRTIREKEEHPPFLHENVGR